MDARQPVLEREGFLQLGLRALEHLVAQPPQRSEVQFFSIRMTSGTSGRTPIIMASEHKADTPVGFEHCRTLVIAQGGNNARVGNTLFTLTKTKDPTRILAIDDSDLVPGLESLFQDLAPDAFRGFPSFIRRVGAYLGDAREGVRAIKITGEKWTPVMQADFERTFPNARCEIIYGIVEVGVVATSDCPHLARDHYHPVSDAVIGVDAPDESGMGELLISRPFYRDFYAAGYKVGDIGRLDPAPCACGRKSFELFGRRGTDFLKVAGAVLFREEFDRVAVLCSDLFDDYRAQVSRITDSATERGRIELTVYRRDGAWSDELARNIAARFSGELFLTPTRTLAALAEAGYFEPLSVIRREEPFPFRSKEVKLSERRTAS
jgi:phenylacetate-coenzyme A ligase PaaK-like adenylate-forming protein